jgi:hypothetical protein
MLDLRSIVCSQRIVILLAVCILLWQQYYIWKLEFGQSRCGTSMARFDMDIERPEMERQRLVTVMKHRQLLTPSVESPTHNKVYGGVAVTTFLGAPKWFQNRYSLMINQVLTMLDDDWLVQVVYDPSQKMAVEGINYPGVQRQIRRGRVVLTPVPASMKKIKKNALLLSTWFWESLLAEKVLLFGGTAALCANTPYDVANYTQFDYIGAPWGAFQGRGGEGGVSLRSRSAILAAVRDYSEHAQHAGPSSNVAKEDAVLVRALLEQGRLLRVASQQVRPTESFGFGTSLSACVWSQWTHFCINSQFPFRWLLMCSLYVLLNFAGDAGVLCKQQSCQWSSFGRQRHARRARRCFPPEVFGLLPRDENDVPVAAQLGMLRGGA